LDYVSKKIRAGQQPVFFFQQSSDTYGSDEYYNVEIGMFFLVKCDTRIKQKRLPDVSGSLFL
jgi:hypothetical protein